MGFLEWASLIMGIVMAIGGICAVIRQEVRVPETIIGSKAVGIGALWIILGTLFITGSLFDIGWLKMFKTFLEAAN